MTEYRGVIAGTGNAVTGINEISGGLTARYLYNILGYSSGVLKDALSEFNMTYTNLTFSVAGGQAVAYGYIGEITTTSEFTFTAPSANSKYYFVYLDFDLRETIKKFAVSYYDNSNSDVWSPRQDNLANNDVGRFQLPIYKIKIDSDNTITVTDLREIKQIVKDATKINGMDLKRDENGILKIGDVIIPQRKLLWSGEWGGGSDTPANLDISSLGINQGDTLELEIEWSDTKLSTNKYIVKMNSAIEHLQLIGKVDPIDLIGGLVLNTCSISISLVIKAMLVDIQSKWEFTTTPSINKTSISKYPKIKTIYKIIE